MKKNKINTRQDFVKLAVNDPLRASAELERQAREIRMAKTFGAKLRVLSDILYLSVETIYRDAGQGFNKEIKSKNIP